MSRKKRFPRLIVADRGGPPVFLHGLLPGEAICPKCDGALEWEPAFARCRFGCGKLWPIRSGELDRQVDYERRSGLETPQPP